MTRLLFAIFCLLSATSMADVLTRNFNGNNPYVGGVYEIQSGNYYIEVVFPPDAPPDQYRGYATGGALIWTATKTASLGTAQTVTVGGGVLPTTWSGTPAIGTATVTQWADVIFVGRNGLGGYSVSIPFSDTGDREWKYSFVSHGTWTSTNTPAQWTNDPPAHLIYTMTIGTMCGTPRTGLNFGLGLTINPSIAGGWAEGNYVANLEIDGTVVYTANLPLHNLPPGPVTVDIATTGVSTPAQAFSYAWKVNGETVASDTLACGEEIPLGEVYNTADYTAEYEPGEGESEPEMVDSSSETTDGSGNTTNTDTTNTTTSPGSYHFPPTSYTNQTANSTVNHSGVAGDSITNQDIYNDVKQALLDAGRTGNYPDPPTGGIDDEFEFEEADLEGMKPLIEDIHEGKNEFIDGIAGFKTAIVAKFNSLPTSIPKVHSISFGTFTLGPKTIDLTIDFDTGKWSTIIHLIRACMLYGLTIYFMIQYVQEIRFQLATL